jgi:glucose dehydrogenase
MEQRKVVLNLLAACALVLLATAPSVAGPTLLWSDRFRTPDGTEIANAVDSDGLRVFAAGGSRDAAGRNLFLVRAYDARSGSLLWQADTPASGFATAVLAEGDVLFVAGGGIGLKAYDAASGALFWEDHTEVAGRLFLVNSIAARGSSVFVAGASQKLTGNFDVDFFVRAYNAQTGVLLWEDLVDKTGRDDVASAVALGAGKVFVAGWSTNAGPLPRGDEESGRDAGNSDVLIRAYDAVNGSLLWEDVFDRAGGDDLATSLVVRGRRVVIGGMTETNEATGARNFDALVRTYDGATGEVLWHADFDSGPFDFVSSIATKEGRVFAAGQTRNAAGNTDMLVQAYDIWTGARLWTDIFDNANGADFANAVAAGGRHKVFVAGRVTDEDGNIDFVVRAYESRTGDLLWRDQFDIGRIDEARDLAVEQGRVFAVGFVEDEADNFDFVVRAYSLR